MRLRARAFFFEDREGHALALVSCDLFALPGGLHAKVAERVAAEAARKGLSLPPESLILAATHTHHSPGNYLTAQAHNQFGSAYSGFSKPLFEFLTDKIANAVLRAMDDARRHPGRVELSVHVHEVDYHLLRNRSPQVFMVNHDYNTLLDTLNGATKEPPCEPEMGEPPTGWELPGCPRLRATDRTLTVVDLHRVNEQRRDHMGALVFFAVHPTVLGAHAPLYNSDFVGYAMQSLERSWATPEGQPVVGFFNGAEGDITARRNQYERDMLATVEMGGRLAEAVEAALARTPVATEREPAIAVRATQVSTRREEERTCTDPPRAGDDRGSPTWKLAQTPMFGAAALGGAEDDHSVLNQLGWSEGTVDRAANGQGFKLPALDSRLVRAFHLSDVFAPPKIFPNTIPLALVSLGGLTLATLPGEVSTAEGLAIRKALGQQPHGKLEFVGLANEYISYCSSADEYNVQDYMGASTMWGPDEGPFIACRLRKLAASEPGSATRKVERREFWPGPEFTFGPAFMGDPIRRPDEGLHEVLRDKRKVPARQLPWFAWDGPTGMCGKNLCQEEQPRARIAIWQRTQEGWHPLELPHQQLEDDLGTGFITVLLDSRGHWGTVWLRPLFQPMQGTFAFVAHPTAGGPPSCSKPFTLGAGTPVPDETEAGPGACDSRGAPTDSAAATGPKPTR